MLARLVLLSVVMTGCHAKFKKAAPFIDDINVQVVTTGGPYVSLGQVPPANPDDGNTDIIADIATAAINVTQEVRSANQTARIASAVNIHEVNDAMTASLAQTLANGPPFAYTNGPADAMLQLEVVSYGVNVPYLGAPGELTYSVNARIYDNNGDRVYRKNMTCALGLGDPHALEVVFSTVNNVKQLNEMSDDEINVAFMNVAAYCGQYFVTRMRSHAS